MAATVASLTFASFAGCSQDDAGPTAAPTSAAPAVCTPATATVSWGQPSSTKDVVVTDVVLTYAKDRSQRKKFYTSSIPIVWDTGALSSVAPTANDLDEWKIFLRNDLVGTGEVPDGFGFPLAVNEDDITVTPVFGPPGRVLLLSSRTPLTTVAFVAACPGLSASGSVTAPLPGAFLVRSYRCGDARHVGFTAAELARCPKP